MDRYVMRFYRLYLKKHSLPAAHLRAVFLTDMHNTAGERETEEILRKIRKVSPDLILCGGDMLVGKAGKSVCPAARFLRRLASVSTVYLGTGNHEYRTRIYPEQYGSMYEDYRRILADADVCFLENKKIRTEVRGIPVEITGFEMKAKYYRRIRHKKLPVSELTEAVGEPDREALTVLLAHNPSGMEAYGRWGADLTLCGHYHGGMVRFGRHHGLVSPDFRLFPGNAYGLFCKKDSRIIVSAGCGEHTIPVRINNPREIVVVDFHLNEQE
jgi:predicted MPP superfamily phosphohydrolase